MPGPFDFFSWTSGAVDVVYTCPGCKKCIGLETRFLEPGMEFNCPYCKTPLKVPNKGEEDNKSKKEKE